MNGELKKIKKLYGEDFAKMCREFFPVILGKEGELLRILLENFAPNHMLYEDLVKQYSLVDFVNYIYEKFETPKEKRFAFDENISTPEELFEKVGYTLFECKSDEDVKSFVKYYTDKEALCTFRDPYRIDNYRIFFAVKKNAQEIKREDFKKPQRQDEYGTSVISLQFSKGNGWLSIKNRYNHTVSNPDATFGNNLENICPGLTKSFMKHYGINNIRKSGDTTLELDNYVQDNNGKYYKYNYEINNVYYCADNYVIENGEARQYDKCKYELIDYFLLNKSTNKMLCMLGSLTHNRDSFLDEFQDVKKIDIKKLADDKKVLVITKNDGNSFSVVVDKCNRIIGYDNETITSIDNNFLYSNKYLKEINIPNVKKVGNNFLRVVSFLDILNSPSLKLVGDDFLYGLIQNIKSMNIQNLEEVGDFFMANLQGFKNFKAPKLKKIGNNFFNFNEGLDRLDLPSVESVGDCFLNYNRCLKEFNAPNLKSIGDNFLPEDNVITTLNLPNVEYIEDNFLRNNECLEVLSMPSVKTIGSYFLKNNYSLRTLTFPELISVGDGFISYNRELENFNAPKLKKCGSMFLYANVGLKEINMDNGLVIDGSMWLKTHPKRKAIFKKVTQQPKESVLKKLISLFVSKENEMQK